MSGRSEQRRWVTGRTLWRSACAGLQALAVGLLVFSGVGVPAATWLQINAPGHSAPIMRLAVDVGRDLVVTASDDKTARLWTLSEGRPIAVLRPPVGPARTGRLFGAAFHPSEDLVAVAGSGSTASPPGPSIWMFRASNGQFARRLDALGAHVRRLAFTADGQLLAACYAEPGALRVFDTQSGALVFEDRFDGDCLALSARGLQLVAGARDGTVAVYGAAGQRVQARQRFSVGADILSVDLSPRGDRLAAGFFTAGAGAAVFDVGTGRELLRLRSPNDVLDPRPTDPISTTQAVRFASDGLTLTTAGSTSRPESVEGRVYRFDALTGALLASQRVAADTITDLTLVRQAAPGSGVPQEKVVWASFEGSWGVVADGTGRTLGPAGLDFFAQRAARELLVSAEGGTIRWVRGKARTPVSFELAQRRLGPGLRTGLLEPRTRLGLLEVANNFEDHFRPDVAGRRLTLATGEISRALTFIGDGGDLVLATSEGLRRIDRQQRVVWDVRTPTEVRAVNASADGQMVIALLNDGSVRWWRAADGSLLLSALVMADGWVLWMPTGHYDASHGVESRLGWLVDRAGGDVPDYFSVGRFRDAYHRPDVIDRVLALRDPQRAVEAADAARQGRPASTTTTVTPSPPPAPPSTPSAALTGATTAVDQITAAIAAQLPPVLAPLQALRLAASGEPLRLPFSLRSDRPRDTLRVETRLDGQLVEPLALTLPPTLDGQAAGEVVVQAPASGRLLQLVARTSHESSEPLRYVIDRRGAAPLEPSGPAGRLFIVAIGVAQYRDASIRLKLPAKDAHDFVRVMSAQKGALYEDVQARVLTDAEAQRGPIEEAMRWLASQVTERDAGVVFLAGHGVNDPNGRYHFLPWEFDALRPTQTAIPGTVFAHPLAGLRGRALLMLDTCFAGGAASLLGGDSNETARFANTVSAPENAVTVFASSTGRQLSYELTEWGNGAFTKMLTLGLRGEARLPTTPMVTTRSLSPFVQEGVARLTQGKQTPVTVIPEGIPERILAKPAP